MACLTQTSFIATQQSILDCLFEGCYIISPDSKYLYVNNVAALQGRRKKEELLGKSMMEVYPGIENTLMFANLRRCMEYKIPSLMVNEFTFPDQSISWFELRFEPILEGVFILSLEITGARHSEERIKWLMRHDHFTSLPNRFSLIEKMTNISKSENAKVPSFLAVISLENVEELEATYGPIITDEILKQIASRIKNIFFDGIQVYRTKSHQLGLLFMAKQERGIEDILNYLTVEFGKPYYYKEISIHGDIRIGYARLSEIKEDAANYLRKSEIALRMASQKSQSWMVFTPEQDTNTVKENLELLGELKGALGNGQLALHYQPKILMPSGVIHGVEALMRWKHPTLGNIPPGKFIPRAEQSTLIDSLTEWAIDQALSQQVQWAKMGIHLTVAVNISSRNLMLPCFVDTVLHLLNYHQVKGELLELEVTEGAFMLDIESTIVKLKKLSNVNIIISIDDFGTGYSSLQYLNELPVSVIKIDQTFIRTLSANKGSNHIVEAAVNLAHSLQMKVVAEGVEDKETYRYLHDIGCDISQGYYIKRPIPVVEFTEWYKEVNGVFKLE